MAYVDLKKESENPRQVKTEEGTVAEHSLKEKLDIDKYLRSNDASQKPLHGLVISRFKPAGP